MTYVTGSLMAALLAAMVFETWCLWRLRGRLGALARVDERLSSLTHTLMLLTDTTESGFLAVAQQLESEPAARAPASASRVARQRRVVGAARRGRSVTEIAAAEELAEGEVRLRLHLADQAPVSAKGRHGSLRS